MAGGNQSAFGYRYQYLATVERFLRYLRDHLGELATIALHVEPTTLALQGIANDDDIIDFAIEHGGEFVERNQVKASGAPEDNQIYPLEADRVFSRLDGKVGVQSVLLTNRPISTGLEQLCTCTSDADGPERWVFGAERAQAAGRAAVILRDHRSTAELTEAVEELIRAFCSDRSLNDSKTSARIVTKLLLDEIFQSAAGDRSSRFEALDVVKTLLTPDASIAHVVGSFNWGVPISGVPTLMSTVLRIDLLEKVFEAVGAPDGSSIPAVAVAVGQTGHGKSALAADYCHLHRNRYEFVVWIDCSNPELIESRVRKVTEDLTRTVLTPKSECSDRFRAALATHRGPWLVVFDGVVARADVDRFAPTQGNGAVLITSTNEVGWWPTAIMLPVNEFAPDEAARCFISYAGIETNEDDPRAADITSRLARVPLAVAMAGLYFRNAAGTLDELSLNYFDELDALDDDGARPPGFNKTAFAAIEHAVRHLGAGVSGEDEHDVRIVREMLYRASLLAPDMIPLNFLIAILAEVVTVRIPDQPEPVVAEAILRRRYVTIMRTQSIAHRVLVLDQQGEQNEASETIEIHPLVHEILRRIFLRTIRKDRLNEQLTVMMHVIHGWVANLRKRDEYFALDQLVAHANSILTVIEGLSADESVSAEQAEIFRYTRLILQLELSTCLMSKGDYLLSTNLARTALQDLVTVRRNTVTLALTLKAVSSIVIDLNEAGTTAAVMRPFASYAQTVLLQCEAAGPKVAAVGFEYAYGIRSALKARGEFREDPAIATVIDALDSLISRDNSNEMRPNAVMDELQEHISAGELDLVDPLVESLRKTCNSHDAVTLDCLEVDIALRRDEFDSALPALDCLLTLELHKTHRAHPLSRGLAKIYWTLEKLIAEGRGPTDDLRTMSVRARVRAEDLHEQIVAEVDGNTATS